ncbi:MAG: NUDIX domain-containing protein [bacterium]
MSVIQSTGGIVYFFDEKKIAKFLLIKRHAMSGKIERVAPKGKIQPGEALQKAAIREVTEETGISPEKLVIEQMLGMTSLRSSQTMKNGMDKDITYFLMHYYGDPTHIRIQDGEGYLGIYKRATLEEVSSLIYYQNLREIFSQAYDAIGQQRVKMAFLDKIS